MPEGSHVASLLSGFCQSQPPPCGASLSYKSDNTDGLQEVHYRTAVLIYHRQETQQVQFFNTFLATIDICLFETDPKFLSIYGCTTLVDIHRFCNFLILCTVGRTPWTGDQPVARSLPTQRTKQTQNKRRETSMPWVGPTIPPFERKKTVHALNRAASLIDFIYYQLLTL
jgi:hypothetical protein